VVGVVIGLAVVAAALVRMASAGDGSLTVASDELTAGGMMTVLLEDGQVDGFSQRWRGEPPLADGWSGLPAPCSDAVGDADVPSADDMARLAIFDRESDGAELRHRLSRVLVAGASLGDTVAVYTEACGGTQQLDGPDGAAWTVQITAEVLDGPGEEAMIVRAGYEAVDGDGRLTRVEVVWAQGGLVSALTLSGDEVDEAFLLSVADDVEARIVAGSG
jgi:hypothetical protein